MSDGREIVCSRIVFVDSEFDAKKDQGERPGPPICICAIEVDEDGRETKHRLAAPYAARAPWDRGDPYLTVGFALSAEAGSFYPPLKDFYEDKRMIDAVKNLKLEVGADGRNRFWLNPFGTKTSRNNPSTNRALFGLPHTMRSFMKPAPGMALAQIDYGSQEIGFAAALSGDPALIEDYLSGDPYRQFAAASLGILNPTEQQRQIYKATVLGRIYGQGVAALARNLGISKSQAQRIMDQMFARYPVLNAWLERITIKAAHCVPITCVLGWSLTATGRPAEERTFLNFPMQANAAELMRVVIVRASKLNLIGCAHDSFLIEDTIGKIEAAAAEMQAIMRQASRDLLGGFELRADCKPNDIVRYPDRFIDKREREDEMQHWNWLMGLIEEEGDGQFSNWHGDAASITIDREKETPTLQSAVGKA